MGDYCFGYCSAPIPGSENTRRGRNARPLKTYLICAETVHPTISMVIVPECHLNRINRELQN